jgi:hypothetical protein
MEWKTVIRAEIPSLRYENKNTAYDYFKKILGDASDVEDYDGEIEWFEYEGELQPVYDYDTKKWGIDLVLEHKSDYKTYVHSVCDNGVTLNEFQTFADRLIKKFPEVNIETIRFISYDWYNGGDEPIHL